MAKTTAKYETIFIINPNLNEDDTNTLVEKFKSLIEANGTISDVDLWGKRRLAYPINDLNDGYYVLIQFESSPAFPAELDRIYKITDGIMRNLVICTDAQ